MPNAAAYLTTWGHDNTVPFPRELWLEVLPAPAAAYPSIDFLPLDLSEVFTAYLDGEVQLYDQVDVRIAEGKPYRLMLIGTVPADGDMWFVFNADSGQVMMLDIESPSLEPVNSSLAAFTDFLYHFSLFVDADTGSEGRAQRAAELKRRLEDVDPSAFADPESWWNAVIAQLSSAG
ncbi:SUKH-4 family immunity protein [Glycomyces sp. TRM65418]|uniref:SUKH-4 family immunity protein n=1 Tax=Glycomyces sp. TRM65418 TaxID=2867006 RepID=UPI001CE69FE4|nr:SUKH-4 family immunity protein [Glycomyces sp. TRM65418]MCC3764180.1 SUKH-4 family immunity protein [Glycomyces sp. TRM65418]QZD53864.1 SUKH-4 family immunity protein [Glycomyces sp. TRM65418]